MPFIAGIALTALIALIAQTITITVGGPTLLYALLLGMLAKPFADKIPDGVQFSAKTILRVGVALLGFRISYQEVLSLGASAALLVITGVTATIIFGIFAAKFFKLEKEFGILAGGATAICGASAAIAISSVLPEDKEKQRQTTFVIVATAALSTLLMVAYPPILHILNATDLEAGLFIGATIHDVAQVVGAGYMVSPQTGDLATLTKLFRVALLVPVILVLASHYRTKNQEGKKQPWLPWFLVLFVVFAAISSTGLIPDIAIKYATTASQWCLCMAIAALGTKTSIREIKDMGTKPILLTLAVTLFLIVFIAVGMMLF